MSLPLRFLYLIITLVFSLEKTAVATVFLQDEAELYARYPELGQQLEKKLQQFYQQHELPFYVVTKTSTSYHNSLRDEASRLRREKFAPEEEGFLFFYEADSGLFTLSSRPTISETHPEKWVPSKVPQHLDIALFASWKKQIESMIDVNKIDGKSEKFDPQQSCHVIAEAWMLTITNYIKDNQKSSINWRPWVITGVALLVGFVLMHMLGKNANRKRVSESVTYNFPCPKVQVRLGALNSGGGKLVSRLFR